MLRTEMYLNSSLFKRRTDIRIFENLVLRGSKRKEVIGYWTQVGGTCSTHGGDNCTKLGFKSMKGILKIY